MLPLQVSALGETPWMANTRTLAGEDSDDRLVAVACNSVHDEYLIAWIADYSGSGWGRALEVQRISSAGVAMGTPSVLYWDDSFGQPRLFYNSYSDNYVLLAEIDDDSGTLWYRSIYGIIIPWDGSTGSDPGFRVDEPVDGTFTGNYAIAYNPEAGEYLFLWSEDYASGRTLKGRRVLPNGDWNSAEFSVGIADGFSSEKLVWNTESGEYLLVFTRGFYNPGTDSTDYDIRAMRLDRFGTVVTTTEIVLADSFDQERAPDVACCRGNYLVSWIWYPAGDSAGTNEIYARMLSGDGTPGARFRLTNDSVGDYYPVVSCSEKSGEYLVVWQKAWSGAGWASDGIEGAFIGIEAQAGSEFIIYATPDDFSYRYPALAFGENGKALVAWESERPSGPTVIDVRGRLIGDRIFADGFESTNLKYW